MQFNNFDWLMRFYWSYMLLLRPPVLMHYCNNGATFSVAMFLVMVTDKVIQSRVMVTDLIK